MKLKARVFSIMLLLSVLLGVLSFATVAFASEAQQVQFVAPKLVVNTSFLNIRTGPGVQYTVLITVVGGTELPVLGVANDRVWYQVSTVIGVGWVNVEFTLPRGNFENIPVINFSPAGAPVVINAPTTLGLPGQGGGGPVIAGQGGGQPVTTTTTGGGLIRVQTLDGGFTTVVPGERFRAAIITGGPVNLRTQPSITASAITIIYNDVVRDYAVVGREVERGGLEWLGIDVPGFGSGWVEAPKVFLRLSAAFRPVVFANQNAAVFDSPGGSGNVTIPVLSQGTEGFVVGISPDSNFVQLELGGGNRVWVPFSAITTRTGTTTDGLELSTTQPIVVAAPVTTTSTIIAGTPQPPAVITSFGLDTPHIIINTSSLNVRSGPGAQYTSIAIVSGGTELVVLGLASDGVWFLVAGPFGQGWVNNEFVLFRGVIQNVPIIPLSSVTGVLANPTAVISGAVTLYAAPGVNFGAIGTVSGPIEVPVVARSADFTWVQLNTSLGFGWALASQVIIRGDATLIPIVG